MNNIKKHRKKLGFTQQQLADRLGCSRIVVAQWERNYCNPRAELLPKIARILNCTVDELLQPESEEKPKTCCQCKHFCVGVYGEGCECALGFGEVYHSKAACFCFELD